MPVKQNETWMKIIKSSYPDGVEIPTSRIVICDLHFDKNDILKIGDRTTLTKSAIPIIS